MAAWQITGLLGVCLVCALTARLQKSHQLFGWSSSASTDASAHEVEIRDGQVEQVWMLSWVLNVRGPGQNTWIFRDELDPLVWAELRRYLISQVPVQPLGLSMSK